jgi:ADP-heptose:LPS heptosyltransferase
MSRALVCSAGGGIGDSLVASVVARALKQRFSAVDCLTLAAHREALERVPDYDEVLADAGEGEGALARTIAGRDYAACIVTWATPRIARACERARIPVRVGQARRLYSFRFTHRVVVRSERGDTVSHWSDILLDFARVIGCDTAERRYRFVPNADDERQAQAFDASGAIILNPCNAIASKRGVWPVGGWAALARALRERFGARILVSGSPAEAGICEEVAAAAQCAGVVSIAGKLSIGALGALARRARAFVGITTGSMHVAAAVGCPTAGIFPFQSDFPERWAPLGKRTAVVRASYRCHANDTKETCRDYACIAHLDVRRVVAATQALLFEPSAEPLPT